MNFQMCVLARPRFRHDDALSGYGLTLRVVAEQARLSVPHDEIGRFGLRANVLADEEGTGRPPARA
jgi:hypothetical protein